MHRRGEEVQQLDLLAGLGAGDDERDVIGLEAGDAHVLLHHRARDHDGLVELEAEQREEPDRGFDVGDDERDVIEVGHHPTTVSRTGPP